MPGFLYDTYKKIQVTFKQVQTLQQKKKKTWKRKSEKWGNISKHSPERSSKGRKDWESRHVIWFDKGPVVWGERPCQGHLPQSCDKVGTPEEEEDIVELQANQVFVVNGLSTVEGKKALGVRALCFHGTGGVVLHTYAHTNSFKLVLNKESVLMSGMNHYFTFSCIIFYVIEVFFSYI